jgi:hypothetical protein
MTVLSQTIASMNFGMKFDSKFDLFPVGSTILPFKNSDIGLLLGGAVLGFCPDFGIEPFKLIVFTI